MDINKISEEAQTRVLVFLEAVDKSFSFLNEYGYTIKEERLAPQYVVKDIFEVLYKNEDLDRVVRIQYQFYGYEGNPINLVTVSLFKGVKFLNTELGLEYYLKRYKPEFDMKHLTYPDKNNKATFEENMETSIAGFAYLLQDICVNLINGSEWEDGLTFDWSSAEKIMYEAQKKIVYGDNKDKPNP